MATETAQMTIAQFVERHGITLTASRVPLVSWWEGDKDAQSWQCTLKCGSREMSTTFTKGSGHRIWQTRLTLPHMGADARGFDRPKEFRAGRTAPMPSNPTKYDRAAYLAWTDPEPPTAAEVLDSLASDASSADQSFEDWCGDYGYDTDSRKAEAAYNACRETMFNLRKLLGARDLETLLNDVERM